MENAQKAIMIGVGLFITIIIIAAVMLITGIGQNMLNKGTDKASGIAAQLDQTELEEFDGRVVSGAKVLSTIKKYWNDENVVIYVKNTTNAAATPNCTTYNSVNNITTPTAITDNSTSHETDKTGNYDSNSTVYPIGSGSRYDSNLIKVNGSIVGVYFTAK